MEILTPPDANAVHTTGLVTVTRRDAHGDCIMWFWGGWAKAKGKPDQGRTENNGPAKAVGGGVFSLVAKTEQTRKKGEGGYEECENQKRERPQSLEKNLAFLELGGGEGPAEVRQPARGSGSLHQGQKKVASLVKYQRQKKPFGPTG